MTMPSRLKRDRFAAVVAQSEEERRTVRTLVQHRQWTQAEPDVARLKKYLSRIGKKPRNGSESMQGATLDLQQVSFLVEGADVRRAVAYVEVNTPSNVEFGTGFMISPELFLTCQHVIADATAARGTQLTFNREMDDQGRPRASTSMLLDPEMFALFSPENELDYAVIAVGNVISGDGAPGGFPYCPLSDSPDRHALGMNVNIIQHPRAWPKMISVRNNLLTHRTERTLLYETDTDEGSSGAPVFNDDWDIVALHHWGQPFLEKRDDLGQPIPVNVNEGVRISAIYRDLKARLGSLDGRKHELLRKALALADQPKVNANGANGAKKLGPPHATPAPKAEALTVPTVWPAPNSQRNSDSNTNPPPRNQPLIMSTSTTSSSENEFRFTVPIEITVRVPGAISMPGAAVAAAAGAAKAALAAAPKRLTPGAEGLKIDKNYDSRKDKGYKKDFIPGFDIPLPEPNAELKSQIAPLRAEEDDAEGGELKYEHFSVKMNKGKRIAIFTATNIDGATYLVVDRKTGEVSDAEGETWYKDPRISASFYLDQTFYSDWSTYFDRGHLTRRTDPTWGTKEEAERANADTYHFTNCSPQHFRFNQTTKYWQGAERYLLEKGVLANPEKKEIIVFQGPIFNDAIDQWADDVQIPSEFFKVIVWKGAAGLKSVGLIVDQSQLLSETRSNLGQPRDEGNVSVKQWRVSIQKIQEKTGLDFGQQVSAADTIGEGPQPVVGAEAAKAIRSFDDLFPAGVL